MKFIIVSILAILLLTAFPQKSQVQAAIVQPDIEQFPLRGIEQNVPAKCTSFNHHVQNRNFHGRIWNTSHVYVNIRTGDVVAFAWIAECGSYFMSVWRGWKWKTNYFPKGLNANQALGYIMTQVSAYRAVKSSVGWGIFKGRTFTLALIVVTPPHPCWPGPPCGIPGQTPIN